MQTVTKDMSKNIFVIPGMPRTGSTFLYHTFQQHPFIFVPYRKETNYFCTLFEKGTDWYLHEFYQGMRNQQVGVDISPAYFLHPDSISRIKKFNPNIKIILGIRLPSDWILSEYSQILSFEWKPPSFQVFIEKGAWIKIFGGKRIYVDFTNEFIIRTIEKYQEAFGDNLLLYQYEFFQNDPLSVIQTIENFVGVPAYFNENNFENTIINAGNRKNIKIIQYLLHQKGVIPVLTTLLPERVLRLARGFFDKKVGKKLEGKSKVYTPENIELAKKTLAKEDAYVTELFSKYAIQRGDGSPFGHFN